MPRGKLLEQLSIRELQQLIQTRRSRLTQLRRDRRRVIAELNRVDRAIAKLDGSLGARGRRASGKSLVETIKEILARAGKPMTVGDIMRSVEATGYRSTSLNFRSIVNQTLVRERKHFAKAGRALYTLKK